MSVTNNEILKQNRNNYYVKLVFLPGEHMGTDYKDMPKESFDGTIHWWSFIDVELLFALYQKMPQTASLHVLRTAVQSKTSISWQTGEETYSPSLLQVW